MKNNFYDYDDLKSLINEIGVNTKNEYISVYKTLTSPEGKKAPIDPRKFYGNNIWNGWSDFLNKPIHKKKLNNLYYSFDECKSEIKKLGIKSKNDFYSKIKNIIRTNIRIPYSPPKIYKDAWISWGDFLSTNRIQDNIKEYLPYDIAKEWARSLNLKMYKEWKVLDLNKIPDNIPKKPEKTYKLKGWVDYEDWLGIDKKTRISYGEKIIFDILELLQVKFKYNTSILDCKKESKLRFDFFLYEKNICIEFDGIQHFQPVEFFGGLKEFEDLKVRDGIKNDFCKLNNIKLIRIPYFYGYEKIVEILTEETK